MDHDTAHRGEVGAAGESQVLARYRETLEQWAGQYVPEGARVTSVQLAYDDGYEYTFTDRPASLDVHINYQLPGDERNRHNYTGSMTGDTSHVVTSVGELLTALFAIEDRIVTPSAHDR